MFFSDLPHGQDSNSRKQQFAVFKKMMNIFTSALKRRTKQAHAEPGLLGIGLSVMLMCNCLKNQDCKKGVQRRGVRDTSSQCLPLMLLKNRNRWSVPCCEQVPSVGQITGALRGLPDRRDLLPLKYFSKSYILILLYPSYCFFIFCIFRQYLPFLHSCKYTILYLQGLNKARRMDECTDFSSQMKKSSPLEGNC